MITEYRFTWKNYGGGVHGLWCGKHPLGYVVKVDPAVTGVTGWAETLTVDCDAVKGDSIFAGSVIFKDVIFPVHPTLWEAKEAAEDSWQEWLRKFAVEHYSVEQYVKLYKGEHRRPEQFFEAIPMKGVGQD